MSREEKRALELVKLERVEDVITTLEELLTGCDDQGLKLITPYLKSCIFRCQNAYLRRQRQIFSRKPRSPPESRRQ